VRIRLSVAVACAAMCVAAGPGLASGSSAATRCHSRPAAGPTVLRAGAASVGRASAVHRAEDLERRSRAHPRTHLRAGIPADQSARQRRPSLRAGPGLRGSGARFPDACNDPPSWLSGARSWCSTDRAGMRGAWEELTWGSRGVRVITSKPGDARSKACVITSVIVTRRLHTPAFATTPGPQARAGSQDSSPGLFPGRRHRPVHRADH